MSQEQLPKALQLAEQCQGIGESDGWPQLLEAAAELRRLHAELEQARAALAAQGEPVAWEARFVGETWWPCSREHYGWVKAHPHEFEGYEVRSLYTAPPAPAKPMTDEEIRAAVARLDPEWLDCPMGFTSDLARAILALRPATTPNLACESVQARLAAQWGYVRPVQVPMSKQDAWDNSPVNSDWEAVDAYLQGIEDAESHHGITDKAGA